ncbi:MAG: hypothetical protein IJI98_10335 [Methanosphaera sp.]|nr:hypothetical protein [Methanosphaera sp.]
MKRIHYIAIIVILTLVLGLFLLSPYSPLNKSTIDGKAVKLPTGYTVQKSSDNTLTIGNGTHKIYIISQDTNNVNAAIKKYENKYNKTYNITIQNLTLDNGKKVIKTTAKEINGTHTALRYWFKKDKNVVNIKTAYTDSATENNIKSIISSMN